MKKLLLVITLLMSGGLIYTPHMTAKVDTASVATPTQGKISSAALTTAAEKNVYDKSVIQLKQVIPRIVASVNTLTPKLQALVKSAMAEEGVDYLALITGSVALVTDSATRNAIIELGSVVADTVRTSVNLANADPSYRQTVKDLLLAVKRNVNVSEFISLVKEVPGGETVAKGLEQLLRAASVL